MSRFPRARALLLVFLVSLLLGGCASSAGRRDVGSWLEARGADAMDVVGVRVALGAGLGVYARATEVVQIGFMRRGSQDAQYIGTTERRLRAVPCVMFGTIGRYGGVWFDTHDEFMFPTYSSRDHSDLPSIHRKVLAGAVSLDGSDDRLKASIGAGVHALLVGAEAEIRPFEILDLLAGLLGFDPSSDDIPVAEVADA